jgi:hypothetical protein
MLAFRDNINLPLQNRQGLRASKVKLASAYGRVDLRGILALAGNPFMARQSYLANEIKWGYQFVRCIHRPHGSDTQYTVDTAKWAGSLPLPTSVIISCIAI